MTGVTVRLTSPSRSRLRKVSDSIRCDTLGISRRSSLNRFDPSPSVCTTSTVHLSPIRESNVLIVRHTGFARSFISNLPPRAVTELFAGHNLLVAHQKSGRFDG